MSLDDYGAIFDESLGNIASTLGRIEKHLAALVRVQLMAWEYQARVAEGDLTIKEIADWIESMGLEDYRDHVLNQQIAGRKEVKE